MPAIDFPASPSINDEYSFEGRTWRWNGTGWEVKEYPAALLAGTAANPSLYFSGDTNTGLYSPGADQVAISTGGTGRLFVNASGNVGIGATPVVPFDIQDAQATQRLYSTTGTNTAHIQFRNASGFGYVGLDDSAGSALGAAYALSLVHTGLYPITFATNGTERLRIDSTGKVGIGTSSPGGALDVVAGNTGNYAIIANNSYSSGDQNFIQFQSGAAILGDVKRPNGTNDVKLSAGYGDLVCATGTAGTAAERLRIASDGKVGIGTSTPASTLHVVSGLGVEVTNIQSTNTAKSGRYLTTHYDLTEEPIGVAVGLATLSESRVAIGGGTSNVNAATSVEFYTASNTTTLGGSERARFDNSGRLLVGRGSAVVGSAAKVQTSTSINIQTPVYSDNAAAIAGGLVAGDIYRKADGTLMITF